MGGAGGGVGCLGGMEEGVEKRGEVCGGVARGGGVREVAAVAAADGLHRVQGYLTHKKPPPTLGAL